LLINLNRQRGDFLCAESGGGREIVASRRGLHDWEIFELVPRGDDRVALRVYSGQYVSVENDASGAVVVARRNTPHERTVFTRLLCFDIPGSP
jgi:hypothetical protein